MGLDFVQEFGLRIHFGVLTYYSKFSWFTVLTYGTKYTRISTKIKRVRDPNFHLWVFYKKHLNLLTVPLQYIALRKIYLEVYYTVFSVP